MSNERKSIGYEALFFEAAAALALLSGHSDAALVFAVFWLGAVIQYIAAVFLARR